MKKFYYVKRTDGSTVDIPERDIDETLKRHKDWQIMDESTKEDRIIIPDAPKQELLHCPICGLESKTEHGLKIHKARKH